MTTTLEQSLVKQIVCITNQKNISTLEKLPYNALTNLLNLYKRINNYKFTYDPVI